MIVDKLKRLEENISALKRINENFSVEDLAKNKFDEWALRYGLFESIQIMIDVSCAFVSDRNLGNPNLG